MSFEKLLYCLQLVALNPLGLTLADLVMEKPLGLRLVIRPERASVPVGQRLEELLVPRGDDDRDAGKTPPELGDRLERVRRELVVVPVRDEKNLGLHFSSSKRASTSSSRSTCPRRP